MGAPSGKRSQIFFSVGSWRPQLRNAIMPRRRPILNGQPGVFGDKREGKGSFRGRNAISRSVQLGSYHHQAAGQASPTGGHRSLGVREIVGLPPNLKELWRAIPPKLLEIGPCLEPVKQWLASNAEANEFVLIEGEFGACCLMVRFALEISLAPGYSTTLREAQDLSQGPHHGYDEYDDKHVEIHHLLPLFLAEPSSGPTSPGVRVDQRKRINKFSFL
jgi:hypothetical protein